MLAHRRRWERGRHLLFDALFEAIDRLVTCTIVSDAPQNALGGALDAPPSLYCSLILMTSSIWSFSSAILST